MRVACCNCKSPVDFEDLDQPDIRNFPACSVIIIEHSQQVTCACGAVLALFTGGVKVGFSTATVPPKQRTSPIVIPGRIL
ncbi:MAG TPA: hypothetical protein VHX37_13315 [Acidobacteriaceae bacterium]|jgi:hypothetical protein|nr:hypothetical protein [Acidobacteriaceae bacterium]